MSENEHGNGQLVDGMLLCGMTNLKCSEGVDQTSAEISTGENLTWSSKFLTFSNPSSASKNESFAADPSANISINQEKNDFNSSRILLNAFDSTGMPASHPSITVSPPDSIPMTELSSFSLNYRSEASLPLLPIPVSSTSCTGKDFEKVPNHESTYSHFNRQTPIRKSIRKDKDLLDSTDILQEAVQILQSLTFDISRSLDDIPKSIALPSVIEKYSRRSKDNSSLGQNAKVPVGDISTLISPCDEILQLLAALQCRCLEYREATLDIAESIVKECLLNFSGVSICVMKGLINRYDGLRDDFTDFKKLCFRAKGSRTGAEPLSSLITDCLQTSYLRLLVEENETFLVRLKFGIYMVRVNARLMRDLKEASARVQKLEEEVAYITRTTIGYRV